MKMTTITDNRRRATLGKGITLTAIKKEIKTADPERRAKVRRHYRDLGLLGSKTWQRHYNASLAA